MTSNFDKDKIKKGALIKSYLGDKGKDEWAFWFSTDRGKSWQKTIPGKYTTLKEGKSFLWRVELFKEANDPHPFKSPFLNKITLVYFVE